MVYIVCVDNSESELVISIDEAVQLAKLCVYMTEEEEIRVRNDLALGNIAEYSYGFTGCQIIPMAT